jgi:hypothetical protein
MVTLSLHIVTLYGLDLTLKLCFFRRKSSDFKDLSDLATTGNKYEIGDPIWKRQVLKC